jgi:hypothetical protein
MMAETIKEGEEQCSIYYRRLKEAPPEPRTE